MDADIEDELLVPKSENVPGTGKKVSRDVSAWRPCGRWRQRCVPASQCQYTMHCTSVLQKLTKEELEERIKRARAIREQQEKAAEKNREKMRIEMGKQMQVSSESKSWACRHHPCPGRPPSLACRPGRISGNNLNVVMGRSHAGGAAYRGGAGEETVGHGEGDGEEREGASDGQGQSAARGRQVSVLRQWRGRREGPSHTPAREEAVAGWPREEAD